MQLKPTPSSKRVLNQAHSHLCNNLGRRVARSERSLTRREVSRDSICRGSYRLYKRGAALKEYRKNRLQANTCLKQANARLVKINNRKGVVLSRLDRKRVHSKSWLSLSKRALSSTSNKKRTSSRHTWVKTSRRRRASSLIHLHLRMLILKWLKHSLARRKNGALSTKELQALKIRHKALCS